jgi:AcrR family transcriptional regulator
MAVLGKTRPPRSRAASTGGRRSAQALSRERIVSTAFDLVAEEGLAAFSTRKLGDRLGCEAMSIYHHFPSKHHLLDAMIDRAIGSMEVPPADLAPLERLRHFLHAYREMANRHAAFYPLLAVHRLNTETGVRMIESVLGLLSDVLPDVELTARHFRAVGYYITGAALDETSGYARGPSAAEPISDAYVAQHCPLLAACAPYFKTQHWSATYELGLDALLARIEADATALASSRRRRRGGS